MAFNRSLSIVRFFYKDFEGEYFMPKYSKADIKKLVEENGVKFIRLQFTDIFGFLKNVAITDRQLDKALNNEICLMALLY